VRYLRRGRKVRLVDLAARAGISLGRLSAIETGKYVAWHRAADRIAVALDFRDAADLLARFYGQDLPVADPGELLRERPDG
jgi:transcriptional regulator with XRE-family HTH domain